MNEKRCAVTTRAGGFCMHCGKAKVSRPTGLFSEETGEPLHYWDCPCDQGNFAGFFFGAVIFVVLIVLAQYIDAWVQP